MTDDLRRDLQQLPPHMDVSPALYDRVIRQALRRRRVSRAGSTSIAAAVVGAAVAVAVSATGSSSTAQIIPVAPPAATITPSRTTPSTPSPTATAMPTPATGAPSPGDVTSTPAVQPTVTPNATSLPEPPPSIPTPPPTTEAAPSAKSPAAPPSTAPVPTGSVSPDPVTPVASPPLTYADLPHPTACTIGGFPDADQGAVTTLCVPDGYLLTASTSCPAGSATIAGEGACFVGGVRNVLVAPVPNAGLPPIRGAALVSPVCEAGYTMLGNTSASSGPIRCIPDAYLPRTGYICPSGSQLQTDPAPLCFAPGAQTVIAPVKAP